MWPLSNTSLDITDLMKVSDRHSWTLGLLVHRRILSRLAKNGLVLGWVPDCSRLQRNFPHTIVNYYRHVLAAIYQQ